MIYLDLFLTFLKIGAVSFGGGYGMISLIREDCLANGWLTEESLINFIAVAESTPGPIAVNMATFVGSAQGGALGALVATLGIVLPSFVIILLVAALFSRIMKHPAVNAVLGGVRPAVIGMILSTALTIGLGVLFDFGSVSSAPVPDIKAIIIFFALIMVSFGHSRLLKRKISPILLILISAGLGMLFFGI